MVKALHTRRHRGDPRRRLQPHRRGQPPRPDARASAASTTSPTTGWCPTTRASTWTSRAPATRSTPVHPSVLRLIMDSLRYWVDECHVDGFRFDLASALARELYDVDRLAAFFDVIHQDPILSQVKLIAEPWDVGPGGYQVGNFPVLWSEWNGIYRDTMRDFWRGAGAASATFARALHRLQRPLRRPTAATRSRRSTSSPRTTASRCATSSPTTRSTTRRTSRTTATGPTTTARGTAASRGRPTTRRSTRCARASSATSSPRCSSPRARRCCSAATSSAARRAATTTPGARTTRSPGSTGTSTRRGSELLEFTRRLIALRREHPVFRRRQFLHGTEEEGSGLPDVWWFRPDGRRMTRARLGRAGARRSACSSTARRSPRRTRTASASIDDSFLLLFNAHHEDVDVHAARPRRFGRRWALELAHRRRRTLEPGASSVERRRARRRCVALLADRLLRRDD